MPVAEGEVVEPLREDGAPVDDVLRLEPLGEIDERAVSDRDEDRIVRAARGERAGRVVALVAAAERAGVEAGQAGEDERLVAQERVHVIAGAEAREHAVGRRRVVVSGEEEDRDRREGGERVAGALERVLSHRVVVEDVTRHDDGIHAALFRDLRHSADDLEALEAGHGAGVPRDERELQPELPVRRVQEAQGTGHAPSPPILGRIEREAAVHHGDDDLRAADDRPYLRLARFDPAHRGERSSTAARLTRQRR